MANAPANVEGQEGETQGKRVVGRPFDSQRAREAGLASAAKRRAKPSNPQLEGVEVDPGAIVRALRKKAEAGDVNAARELRVWLAERGPEDGGPIDPALWTHEQRAQARAELLRQLDELVHSPAQDQIGAH